MKTRALKFYIICSLVVAFTGPIHAQNAAAMAEDAASAQKSDQERIKRIETSLALTTSIEEAAQLVRVKDYAKARTRYQSVIELATGGGANVEIRARAQKELAALAALQAQEAEKEGKLPQARGFWQEAISLDPGNTAYIAGLKNLEAKDPPLSQRYGGNTAATPELLEKVTQIQKLLFEGDSFHSSGQYQRAISRYKEILIIDPYHKVARQRIERTEKAKYRAASVLRDAQREKALLEVDEVATTKPVLRRQAVAEVTVNEGTTSNVANIFDKLEKIIIPELNFTDVDVADAVRFLTEQSKALDPERKGINFVLKVNPTSPVAPAAPTAGGAAGAPATPPPPSVQRTFSLSVRQVPLSEVLRLITDLTNLQFKVEEYAVYIFPSTETSDVLVVRSFSVPPNFFTSRPQPRGEVGVTGAETVQFVTADVKQELEQKGVSFPNGASAAYLPRSAKLIVRNTLDQINLISQLLSEQSDVTTQIEIETKFLEFTDDKFKELAFNYRLYGDTNIPSNVTATFLGSDRFLGLIPGTNQPVTPLTPPSGSSQIRAESNLRDSTTAARILQSNIDSILGTDVQRNSSLLSVSAILSGNGVGMFIRALESQLGADLLSAPKVTVVNGQKTKIRVSRELIYPTQYEPPQVQTQQVDTGGSSSTLPPVVVPSNPSEFTMRDVGVTLEVKADATKDRRIDLEIVPEVNEFQGFINYGSDATSVTVNDAGVSTGVVTVAEGLALQPVFAMRKVETKVQVVDGQTVMMGGFIREDTAEIKDKVPLLGDIPLVGRLFQSKTSRNIKRNLIIFTTARIINSDGTPKFLTENEADALETLTATQP